MQFTPGEKRRLKLIALLALNVGPLVGVVVLDWSLVALLTVYWIELGACLGFAALEALFAEGKPDYDAEGFSWLVIGALSEKRGRIPIPGLPLSIQIANVPAIVMTLILGGIGWLLFGGVGVGGVSEATEATMSDSESLSAGLGIIAVTIGRAVDAASYFANKEYKSVSTQKPLQSALISVGGIGSAMFFGGGLVIAGAPGWLILIGVFAVKLLADIIDVYRDRLEAYDERTSVYLGFEDKSTDWEPINMEFNESPDIVCPNRLALLIGGVVRGLLSPAALLLVTPLLLLGLLAVANPDGNLSSLLSDAVVVLVGTFAVCGVIDRLVRYLCMEYRIAGGVVGYDRVFGPQWRLSSDQLADAERTQTVTDRLFGTETVVVEQDDRTIRLPHLSSRAMASF
ncbi:hypothetical protein AUR64_03780 [Haloprofundus marisrubri]|uniref:Uncharacterized protein n=1 Tax=Haloprofundus marisrubri TaxID=1514971 RepID=A0A0W1RD20_9EURY|nr:DUF6498-containing protein [Haloprofundus marisrubri]KTG11385.1 hypothetical protein AUR64_03780 [Haloprofundus marisrubri]